MMTIQKIKKYLVREMHYEMEDLEGLSREDLLEGLDEEEIDN